MRTSKKRTAAKKKTSHYPVVRGGQLEIATGLPGTTRLKLVNVEEELSKSNRRLYRHARYYQAKVDLHPDATGIYKVYALRDDWAVQKAVQLAYAMYIKETKEERAVGQAARWEDFRTVWFGNRDKLVSSLFDGIGTQPLISGEFFGTRVTDSAGVARQFTWDATPTASQYGLLVEYDKAGNAMRDPTTATNQVPYSTLNDELNDQTMLDLENIGDNPPYDATGVNASGMLVQVGVLGGVSGTQRLSTGFFTAPCGFILIEAPAAADEGASLTFEVKAGDYKGVHAPSMLE